MTGLGKRFAELDDDLRGFIARQHVFFVATAPSGSDGHVNLSPKGLDGTFTLLDRTTVAYLDLIGSGIETVAHLRDNGRIVLMFCAFEGPPRVVRLHGRGEAVTPGHPDWESLAGRFPAHPGRRAVIRVAVQRVADSCGYGVPLLRFEGERTRLTEYHEKAGPERLAEYVTTRNAESIDGLPGLL